jgi:hypothetical protein
MSKSYQPFTKFNPQQLLAIVEKEKTHWMSFDIANVKQSEAMKGFEVKYVTVTIKVDGKFVPGTLELYPFRTTSRVSRPENKHTGTLGNTCYIQSRIVGRSSEEMAELAKAYVEDNYPDLDPDEAKAKITHQTMLFEYEMYNWLALEALDGEFRRCMCDKKILKELAFKPGKGFEPNSFIQYGRKFDDENDDPNDEPDEVGQLIPLDNPIIRFRVRVGKDEDLWCKVFDKTKKVKRGFKTPEAMTINEFGKLVKVDGKTFPSWLTPTSICTGVLKMQICVRQGGVGYHLRFSELNAIIAAKREVAIQSSDTNVDLMYGYDIVTESVDDKQAAFDKGVEEKSDDNDLPDAMAQFDMINETVPGED